ELEDQLAGRERDELAFVLGRQPVELGERQLPLCRAQPRAEREQRRGDVGGMRRRAEVVCEDRVLAVFALLGVAAIAAVQPAWVLKAPVPAARRLEQVAADRAHVAELR